MTKREKLLAERNRIDSELAKLDIGRYYHSGTNGVILTEDMHDEHLINAIRKLLAKGEMAQIGYAGYPSGNIFAVAYELGRREIDISTIWP